MPHRSIERRLGALEQFEQRQQLAADGYAPEAWGRLAPWAIAVYNAGGWEAAIAMVNACRRLPLPCPDNMQPLWDAPVFWQCGDTRRFPSQQQTQEILYCITQAVEQLLAQNVSHTEIASWAVGRQVWQSIVPYLEGTAHEQA